MSDQTLLAAAADFELRFGGCAWEVADPQSGFLERKSFSVLLESDGECTDNDLVFCYCGTHHYSTPGAFAIASSGELLFANMCRAQPIAREFRVFIEREALQDEINNGRWQRLENRVVEDLPRLVDEYHCREIGEATDGFVQWWAGPAIRIERWRMWDPINPPTDWRLSVWSAPPVTE